MKNVKIKANKTKIVARVMLVILLISSAINLAGCGNKGLEAGESKYGDFIPMFMCGYKSDNNEFDIDNVTLDFYYGCTAYKYSVPRFELYFSDEKENMYLIKKVDEELTSEKYNIETKYVPFLMRSFINNLTYNYCEKITIPKELFDKKEGYLFFMISTESLYYGETSDCLFCNNQYKTHILAEQILYYKVDGNIVTIYND